MAASDSSAQLDSRRHESRRVLALTFCVVLIGNLAFVLPVASTQLLLNNDSIGYVAVAVNWLAGQGFVDPILYSHFLPNTLAPVPAVAIRAPIVSLLFAVPLALGANLLTLNVLHALWSALIASASLLLARRSMPLVAAAAAAIAIGWSSGWLVNAVRLQTETTSVGVLFLLLFVAPTALRSRSGAVALAVLTLVGWLTRPNLGVFVAIVFATAVLSWGPRRAFKSPVLWTYVLSFFALQQATALILAQIFGLSPYAHYGVMAETMNMDDVVSFQNAYGGGLSYAFEHLSEHKDLLVQNVVQLGDYAFKRPFYNYVGWIGVPGVLWALYSKGPQDFERKLIAVSAIAFACIALATGWGFAVTRYPLPAIVCAWIAGLAFVADGCPRLIRLMSPGSARLSSWIPRAAAIAPLVVVLMVVSSHAMPRLGAMADWVLAPRRAAIPILQGGEGGRRVSQSLCGYIDPDALVASADPWSILYWCGNAGYRLPLDLDTSEWLDRYLDEMRPGYLVATRRRDIDLFSESKRLTRTGLGASAALFRVNGHGADQAPWRSPGPLANLGPRPD